jgi:hypothetical protein
VEEQAGNDILVVNGFYIFNQIVNAWPEKFYLK